MLIICQILKEICWKINASNKIILKVKILQGKIIFNISLFGMVKNL